jgi:hypothetical protein
MKSRKNKMVLIEFIETEMPGYFSEMKYLGGVCVQGRLCSLPDHWLRNFLRTCPAQRSSPTDFVVSFMDGKPRFFNQEVSIFHPFICIVWLGVQPVVQLVEQPLAQLALQQSLRCGFSERSFLQGAGLFLLARCNLL